MKVIFSKNKTAGFSLLFASLVGGLVLAIGAAILNVTLKQITLSIAGRESQFAFYSADTGLECALYLDRGGNNPDAPGTIFGRPEDPLIYGYGGEGVDFTYTCAGGAVVFDSSNAVEPISSEEVIYNFSVDSLDNNLCFDVSLKKKVEDGLLRVSVESRGLNSCTAGVGKLFERAIRVDY